MPIRKREKRIRASVKKRSEEGCCLAIRIGGEKERKEGGKSSANNIFRRSMGEKEKVA